MCQRRGADDLPPRVLKTHRVEDGPASSKARGPSAGIICGWARVHLKGTYTCTYASTGTWCKCMCTCTCACTCASTCTCSMCTWTIHIHAYIKINVISHHIISCSSFRLVVVQAKSGLDNMFHLFIPFPHSGWDFATYSTPRLSRSRRHACPPSNYSTWHVLGQGLSHGPLKSSTWCGVWEDLGRALAERARGAKRAEGP